MLFARPTLFVDLPICLKINFFQLAVFLQRKRNYRTYAALPFWPFAAGLLDSFISYFQNQV